MGVGMRVKDKSWSGLGLAAVLFTVGGCGIHKEASTAENAANPSSRESHVGTKPNAMMATFARDFARAGVRGTGSEFTGHWVDLFQMTVSDKIGTSEIKHRNYKGNIQHGSWCVSFLQWIVMTTETAMGRKSTLYPSKIAVEMWEKSTALQVPVGSPEANSPRMGWIAVWKRDVKDESVVEAIEKGHAEIVVEDADHAASTGITTVGGNTTRSPSGEDASEGNRVWLHSKHKPQEFGKESKKWSYTFLGYLKAW